MINIFDIRLKKNLVTEAIVDGGTLNFEDLSLGQQFEVISVPVTFSTWDKGDIVELQLHKVGADDEARVLMNLNSKKFRAEVSLKGWSLKVL